MTERNDSEPWLDALAGSHDRLCDIVGGLGREGLRKPSYCDEWTIAQVLSHLGSGAEIFQAILAAVVAGDPPPGRESFTAIWDRWNAMTPEEQAESFLSSDGTLIENLEHLGDGLDDLEFVMFGSMRVDAVGFIGMRLGEHAIHAWDVAVALDPSATVDGDAVALLVDRLPQAAQRAGRAEAAGDERPLDVAVATTDPQRHFSLRIDESVLLAAADDNGDAAAPGTDEAGGGPEGVTQASLQIPAEAFLRLVYGRLDPAHSPPLAPERLVALLRAVFPGF